MLIQTYTAPVGSGKTLLMIKSFALANLVSAPLSRCKQVFALSLSEKPPTLSGLWFKMQLLLAGKSLIFRKLERFDSVELLRSVFNSIIQSNYPTHLILDDVELIVTACGYKSTTDLIQELPSSVKVLTLIESRPILIPTLFKKTLSESDA